MAAADRLIHACQQDTAVLTSLRAWLNEYRETLKERAIKEPDARILAKLQGGAETCHFLAETIGQLVKPK
jgi:hypothetical protein